MYFARLIAILNFVVSASAHSAVFMVNVTDLDLPDTNLGLAGCDVNEGMLGDQCTLRAAVMQANAGPGTDIITLPDSESIFLNIPSLADDSSGAAHGDLDITAPVIIFGIAPGEPTTGLAQILSSTGDRIFDISNSATVSMIGFALGGGTAFGRGGAVFVRSGQVTLNTIAFVNNSALEGGALAVSNSVGQPDSNVIVINSSFFANEADNNGSEVFVANNSNLTIDSSSFHGVQSNDPDVSTIFIDLNAEVLIENTLINGTPAESEMAETTGIIANSPDRLIIRNSTLPDFTGNVLRINGLNPTDEVEIYNSILESESAVCSLSGDLSNAALGYSYVSNITCAAIHESDIVMGPIFLGPLEILPDSVVRSRSPVFGSVVIDAGFPVGGVSSNPNQPCLSTDQRGDMRPMDGDADGLAQCDLGAIEVQTNGNALIFSDRFENP